MMLAVIHTQAIYTGYRMAWGRGARPVFLCFLTTILIGMVSFISTKDYSNMVLQRSTTPIRIETPPHYEYSSDTTDISKRIFLRSQGGYLIPLDFLDLT